MVMKGEFLVVYRVEQEILGLFGMGCESSNGPRCLLQKLQGRGFAYTTREIVTNSTEIQHKTVEGFCCFGRVVGVIL